MATRESGIVHLCTLDCTPYVVLLRSSYDCGRSGGCSSLFRMKVIYQGKSYAFATLRQAKAGQSAGADPFCILNLRSGQSRVAVHSNSHFFIEELSISPRSQYSDVSIPYSTDSL